MGYWRGKLVEQLKAKNPEAAMKIQEQLKALQATPETNTSQARQRATFKDGQGIRLSKDELKQAVGKDYEDFEKIRSTSANFNNGLSENSAATMEGFGWDDVAPTVNASWKDSGGQYYNPTYNGTELEVDTNIPSLAHLVKKKKAATAAGATAAR